MTAPAPIQLVSMPWTVTRAPSIQLGLLKALLDRAGLSAGTCHFYVDFFDAVAQKLGRRRVSTDTYDAFGERLGEWAFAVPPLRAHPTAPDDEAWRAWAAEFRGPASVAAALRVRELVPAFLERCAAEILASAPRVVGFSTTFQQNVPSLVLAQLLKLRDPSLKIVFGGANCEGPMGAALHRLYPFIDVVVRGEAESVVPRLFLELVEGQPVTSQPGLCIRRGTTVHVVEERVIDDRLEAGSHVVAPSRLARRPELAPASTAPTDLNDVPLPVYDEYFARAERGALGYQLDRRWLPYESARGCWWALKHICTFCAANAQYLSFRAKAPGRVMGDLATLSERHATSHVWFVDNIMDERYLRELFPAMVARGQKVSMFVETRAHVRKEQLRAMRDAGVMMVQLGIESLSTPILRLMDKGTSATQNIRVIKWSAELGIQAFYNLIYGFPGEAPSAYAEMADLIPSLSHLEPPEMPVRLRLDRFSPYFRDPDRFGIEILGPRHSRQWVHDLDESDLAEIEYFFRFRYKDGRDPDRYVGRFVDACRSWKASWKRGAHTLVLRQEGGGLRIRDERQDVAAADYVLDELGAQIYRLCDAGAASKQIWSALHASTPYALSATALESFLERLVALRLAVHVDGKYLAVAPELPHAAELARPALPAVSLSVPRSMRARVA
jgi:ribosomal peptide maturation radical SAM protein 1